MLSGTDIAIVLGASMVGAFVKAVTGMGYPLLAVPLIALALGIDEAAAIVAAPNVTANFVLLWNARDARHEVRDLRRLVPTSFAGAVVGTFALVSAPEWTLRVVLVATMVMFVVTFFRSPDLHLDPQTTHRWSPAAGLAAGVMQGAVGVSGPVVATWMHGYRLRPHAYVYAVTAIFGVSGLVQMALLVAAGRITGQIAWVSALAFVPVLAVIPLGARLRGRLGGRGFEHAVLAVIAGSAAALIGQLL